MKLRLVLFGLCCQVWGLSASASSSVTLYGIVDAAVERISSVGQGGGTVERMPGLAGSVPSRFGLRGREDLGDGLAAVFVLESGFAPNTGEFNQGGRAFGRQSWVGVEGKWGQLSLGRQYTMIGTATSAADVMGPATHSIASLDSYYPNARADNSIAYRGKFSGFTVGALYSFGRDAVNAGPSPAGTNCPQRMGDHKACRAYSGVVRYDAASWGVAVASDVIRGGPGAFGGLNSSMEDKRVAVAAYVKIDDLKLGAAVIRRDNEASPVTPRNNIYLLNASYLTTPQLTVDVQYLRFDLKSSPNDADLMILRGMYALSKRTSVYSSIARMYNKGSANFSASSGAVGANPDPGNDQTALAMGIVHSF